MAVSGVNNLNQYLSAQKAKTQIQKQVETSVNEKSPQGEVRQPKPAAYTDMPGRIDNIPDLERYEGAIRRILSGESAMEDPSTPLTEDQIAIRELNRAYQRTDPRSLFQVQQDMAKGQKNVFEYWKANGQGAPMPGCIIKPDGSFVIFSSKTEKDAYIKQSSESFLREVLSVLEARKNGESGSMNIEA